MARTSIKVTVRFAHLIYPYAVPAVLSVCQNQRTPKVMHKSWSLNRHVNDVFLLCTNLTDLYSHAFAPENLSCISLSIVHRHSHMPEHQRKSTCHHINGTAKSRAVKSRGQNQVSTNHSGVTAKKRKFKGAKRRFFHYLPIRLQFLNSDWLRLH